MAQKGVSRLATKHLYELYIVKKNDGKNIRLADFEHVLRFMKTGNKERTEVLITGLNEHDLANPYWQTHKMIWWRPLDPVFNEATIDDQAARNEYQEVLKVIDTLPDINPLEKDSVGTLIVSYGDGADVYTIVDGMSRKSKWN